MRRIIAYFLISFLFPRGLAVSKPAVMLISQIFFCPPYMEVFGICLSHQETLCNMQTTKGKQKAS